MDNDHNFLLPEVPDLTPPIEELPKHVRRFEPDYKYITDEALKDITAGQLAKIEADLHNLRVVYFVNGENPNMLLPNGKTIAAEINSRVSLIARMNEYFEAVLASEEDVE